MQTRTRNALIFASLWLIGCIVFYCMMKTVINRPKTQEPIIKTDTTIIHDTIRIDHFRTITTKSKDTILIAMRDTLTIRDTIFVLLQRETKQYEDSLFKAQISGFEPSLDWIEIYTQTQNITTTIKPKPQKWGVSLQAGYGASKQGLSPYIGVGLSYDLISF